MLAVVVVLLMSRCLSGGDDATAHTSLGIDDSQQLSLAHADEDNPFLVIGFPHVEPFDRERVPNGKRCFLEAHAVKAEVLSRLVVVPFELLTLHIYGSPVALAMPITAQSREHPMP